MYNGMHNVTVLMVCITVRFILAVMVCKGKLPPIPLYILTERILSRIK